MARTYEQIMEGRRARQGAEGETQAGLLAQAYDIAMQIIEMREQHGLTQAELAALCGIDQGDISRIERGATNPTARTLQRIGEVLDADLRLVARVS